MEQQAIESVLTGIGMGGGGASAVALYFIKRYLKQNDDKHDESEKHQKSLTEKLADINTKLAVISARIGEVMNIRDDVKENSRDLAVMKNDLAHAQKDIDKGMAATRDRFKRTDRDIETLKKLKSVGD